MKTVPDDRKNQQESRFHVLRFDWMGRENRPRVPCVFALDSMCFIDYNNFIEAMKQVNSMKGEAHAESLSAFKN